MPYLSASGAMIHEEALYQVYVTSLPLVTAACDRTATVPLRNSRATFDTQQVARSLSSAAVASQFDTCNIVDDCPETITIRTLRRYEDYPLVFARI